MLQTHPYNVKLLFSFPILIYLNLFLHHASATDATVMAALARSLSPPRWTGSDHCNWPGVSCNNANRVTSINLSYELLSGTLPPEINQLSSLQSLSLQRNRLSGPIPSFANQTSLEEINLDFNNFNSTPPDFLSGLTSLQTFSINNNSNLASWRIPVTLRDSTALTTFIASRANVIGQLPDIFDSFPSLQVLRLSYNAMSGPLPASFAQSAIQNLTLNNAGFSGRIDVLGSMTQLREVWLHVNNFSGPIPDLSATTQLTDLLLRDNILTGVIPDSLTRLPSLRNVELQNNVFQGPLPNFPRGVQVSLGTTNRFCRTDPGPCDPQVTALLAAAGALGYPMSLTDSWEGNDACENWRFVLCNRGTVTTVNFARQNWSGTISPAFDNLTGLITLQLNDNHLYGTIPTSLTGLRQLTLLDISNNNITGRLPRFNTSVTVRTSGNVFIGQDVPVTYPPGMAPPAGNEADPQSGDGSVPVWVIVVPVVIVTVVLLALLGFFIYRRYGKNRTPRYKNGMGRKESRGSHSPMMKDIDHVKVNTEVTSSKGSGGKTPMRSSCDKGDYHVHDGGNVTIPIEVIREVTSNFSEDSIIGKGGFGVVYKGQLHDGTRIAVKRMESSVINDKALSEFKAEIEVLTRVRHRHLVALHGYCDTGTERLLVYEYMPQGCLGQHLFEWQELGIPPIAWNIRVSIALDVARGVEYLHSLAQQSFIHRDLKPSNILLGDDMRAKVSDFGLVKSAPDGKFSLETRLAGTFGYLAPEYAATGRVTTKVDVFAFGVILMEMITGRKALDDNLPDEKCHLVTWFRRIVLDKEAIKSELDPTLKQEVNDEMFQTLLKVAELAGHCTARESYQRPDMGHAVNMLSSLVEQWTPAPDKDDEDDNFGMDLPMSLPQVLQKWKCNEDSVTMSSTGLYNTDKQSTFFTNSYDSSNFDRSQ